jgi:hypothetical protein
MSEALLPSTDPFLNRTNRIIIFLVFISVFVNSLVLATSPAEIYIGYVVFVLLIPVFFFRFGIPAHIGWIFGALLITGIVNVYLGKNTFPLFFKVFLGMFFSYLFYFYFLRAFDFKLEKIFYYYLKGAFFVSLLGIFQFISFQIGFKPGYDYTWLLNKWGVITGGNFGIRVNSIFGEPTYLSTTLSPAFFISAYNLFSRKPFHLKRYESITILVVYFLSFSGLGFAGILATLVLINYGLIRYILLFIPILIVSFNFLYNNVSEFQERYDGTVEVFGTGTFTIGKTHGSSIILYNNYHVATENFKGNFLFGTGLGSHPVAFSKFSLTKNVKIHGFDLNSADANSMLLRLISETGLFGTSLMIFVLFFGFIKRNEEDPDVPDSFWLISNSILIMILLNLFRQGHYFLNGFPLFLWIYYYNKVKYKAFISSRNSLPVSPQPSAV